jgi:hypothetical protein
VTSPSPGIHTHVPISPPKARAKPFSLSSLLLVVTCIQVELMRIWALQRPDLNRLQRQTLTMSARKKECNVYSRETMPQRPSTRK